MFSMIGLSVLLIIYNLIWIMVNFVFSEVFPLLNTENVHYKMHVIIMTGIK